VRAHGIDAWRELVDRRECGIVWRTSEMVKGIRPETPQEQRRQTLRETGAWLGTLPPRLALEQEDAVKLAAERCGYSPEAARRDFREKYFRDVDNGVSTEAALAVGAGMERKLDAGIDL
jgi:hypothetical protein